MPAARIDAALTTAPMAPRRRPRASPDTRCRARAGVCRRTTRAARAMFVRATMASGSATLSASRVANADTSVAADEGAAPIAQNGDAGHTSMTDEPRHEDERIDPLGRQAVVVHVHLDAQDRRHDDRAEQRRSPGATAACAGARAARPGRRSRRAFRAGAGRRASHPDHLEESLARVLAAGEPGARAEKRFAAEEPAELRGDERAEQDASAPKATVTSAPSIESAARRARRRVGRAERRATQPATIQAKKPQEDSARRPRRCRSTEARRGSRRSDRRRAAVSRTPARRPPRSPRRAMSRRARPSDASRLGAELLHGNDERAAHDPKSRRRSATNVSRSRRRRGRRGVAD